MSDLYGFTVHALDGRPAPLAVYRGQALLVVNVASECGLTPQYAGLQALHVEYAPRGFAVLGFPCNQFGGQEPGTEAEIRSFCETRYGVTFPMFSKIEVNGPGRAPLYTWLTGQPTHPDGPGDIAWNFAKFVVDRRGGIAARLAPGTAPTGPEVRQAVEQALAGG